MFQDVPTCRDHQNAWNHIKPLKNLKGTVHSFWMLLTCLHNTHWTGTPRRRHVPSSACSIAVKGTPPGCQPHTKVRKDQNQKGMATSQKTLCLEFCLRLERSTGWAKSETTALETTRAKLCDQAGLCSRTQSQSQKTIHLKTVYSFGKSYICKERPNHVEKIAPACRSAK